MSSTLSQSQDPVAAELKTAAAATIVTAGDENLQQPEPKYKVFQTVYARDTDGVMYEAIVRRALYGTNHRKQIQMGMLSSEKEVQLLLAQEEEPTWHYFVHFQKWNVNWDRWVPELSIYEPSEPSKQFAARLAAEHKALRAEMSRKVRGKLKMNGADFLRAWKTKMCNVEAEMGFRHEIGQGSLPDDSKPKVAIKPTSWNKATAAPEMKLREESLTKTLKDTHKIVIPFTLKRVLVEQWEIITQCRLVPVLPASVTVRQALQKYLHSKGITDPTLATKTAETALIETSCTPEPSQTEPPVVSTEPTTTIADTSSDNMEGNEALALNDAKDHVLVQQEWMDMMTGICTLFDEALPERLLYPEEYPQLRVLDANPEFAAKDYCDIYGVEHILRLFVRLPELISKELGDAETRPIFAKMNDFVRFLQRDSTTTEQSNRKLTELELKEQLKMQKQDAKKRMRSAEKLADEEVSNKRAKKAEASAEMHSVE
jgi:mortality factor 4-like protein 1